MKKQATKFAVIFFLFTTIFFAQENTIEKKDTLSSKTNSNKSIDGVTAAGDKINFKNSTGNSIITITDEGSNVGSITLPSGTAPTPTTNKLYNEGGTLKFNGSAIGSGSGATEINNLTDAKNDGSNLFLGTSSGNNSAPANGGNTAVGTKTLYSITTGGGNTAIGYFSLQVNTIGVQNTANGNSSLYSNTEGWGNTANGYQALYSNTTGDQNTANGNSSLYSNTTGNGQTATGYQALYSNTTGQQNTANGYQSLYFNTVGNDNSATGHHALYKNINGIRNTASGSNSLYNNVGSRNTANGFESLYTNTSGKDNTAAGWRAMNFNTTGNYNTANGSGSLYFNTTGDYNVGIGRDANFYNQEGSNNTILGYQAGKGSTAHNKSGNIFLGYQAGYDETTSNKLYIENTSSSTPLIWGNFSNDKVTIHGKLGISTKLSTSKIDISGSNGYDQLRMRTSYTPTGSGDTNGEVGDTAWDDNYVYIKTNSGWKRTALSSF